MSSALSVRHATLDDLDVVVELRLALLREYGEHPLYGRLRGDADARAHDLYASQLVASREAILLAQRGDRVVGTMRLVDTPSSPVLEPDRYCYVSSVYVRPDERRRGVLRMLMSRAEQWCRERGLGEMRLHNSATSALAQSAWTALGFDIVEQVRLRAVPEAGALASAPALSHAETR